MGINGARGSNFALGIWLVMSAFLWHHSRSQLTITWITGIVTAVVALVAMASPHARLINAVIGLWLIVSALSFSLINRATVWNNVIVGILVSLIALVGAGPSLATHRTAPQVTT
jgi:hypothetical protein